MILGINSRSTTGAEASTGTAYNVWRTTVDRNINRQLLVVFQNFVHDQDLNNYIKKFIQEFDTEIAALRKEMDELSLVGPNPGPRDQNVKVNTEAFTDQAIAENIYRLLRLDFISLLLSIKYVPINDDLYEYSIKLTKEALNRIDGYIEFMKSKKWLDLPPIFPDVPENIREQVSVNEIHLLWDHLNFRYNNLRTTQLYAAYAQDKDFIFILNLGLRKLKGQIATLENKLLHFGVPLPRPYPEIAPRPEINKDFFEDRYLFNNILRGIQDALALHGAGIQQVILNDNLRKFFVNFTLDEIDFVTKMVKYGKLKGWAMIPPAYTPE